MLSEFRETHSNFTARMYHQTGKVTYRDQDGEMLAVKRRFAGGLRGIPARNGSGMLPYPSRAIHRSRLRPYKRITTEKRYGGQSHATGMMCRWGTRCPMWSKGRLPSQISSPGT
ncbi:MAG: hypothetical protein QGG56_09325, partial [Dehalococcoidia bacterium]|nr:hypothetical protein [Dehalococcoidia bacterium]